MTRDEALAEWDKLLAVTPAPKDKVTLKAREKASALFAALYPEIVRKDEISANMLLEHSGAVIRTMSQAYQALMNKQ